MILCPKCDNRGFYELLGAKENGDPDVASFLCTDCESGEKLRQVIVLARFEDMITIGESLLPRLTEVKAKLHKADEAGKLLQVVIDETKEMLRRANNGINGNG